MKHGDNKNYERLTKQEADILLSLDQVAFVNQRSLSEKTGFSLGMVNRCLKNLMTAGYLDNSVQITKKGRDLLTENSPRNAIILAAGFGMHTRQINLTTPKALVEVNGQRLIDRLILQLHEANIKDISVVVGFMKDSFEYLIDEYNVALFYNPAYARKNNISSLAQVAEKIGNTYIIPCDIWCAENPFRNCELYSWYMVSDLADKNSEVRVNRKLELVKVSGNINGNKMIGISYLSKDGGVIIRDRIIKANKDSSYDNKFWEELLFNEDRMFVQARVVHSDNVLEINTYEQVRELDSNSKIKFSSVLKVIAEQLNCPLESISDLKILKNGMINRTYTFEIHNGKKSEKYLIRIPKPGSKHLIDRQSEVQVHGTIRGLGFCDDPVYLDPETGIKITRYTEGVRSCDPMNNYDLRACIKKLRSFHNYKVDGKPLTVQHTFDLFERIDFFERLWDGSPSIYRDYQKTKENLRKLQTFIEANREPYQLCHIDPVPDNFLFDSHTEGDLSIQLIDWEYAGMQDKHVDIAMFAIYSFYNKQQTDNLIDLYFEDEGGCNKETRAKIYCYMAISGLVWSNWCEYTRGLGVEFGEYSLRQYRYAKDFYKYAQKLIDEIGKEV